VIVGTGEVPSAGEGLTPDDACEFSEIELGVGESADVDASASLADVDSGTGPVDAPAADSGGVSSGVTLPDMN
jgi:hypothetical protein